MATEDGLIPDVAQAWNIKYDDLEIGKEIGKGAFGSVYKGSYFGTEVAIKRIVEEDPDCLVYLEREVNVLQGMRHPNVVQLIGVCNHESGLLLVTEWVRNGDLRKYLKNSSVVMPWKLRVKIANDVACAMAYLHSRNIIHRDLKAKNLLVDDNWRIKICDFGFARIASSDQRPMTLCGTDDWMAPEVILGMPYGPAADVFSYGVVLAEIVSRKKVTTELQRSALDAYGLDIPKFRKLAPPDTPPGFMALVEQCCEYEPSKRPTFKQIIKLLAQIFRALMAADAKPATP